MEVTIEVQFCRWGEEGTREVGVGGARLLFAFFTLLLFFTLLSVAFLV